MVFITRRTIADSRIENRKGQAVPGAPIFSDLPERKPMNDFDGFTIQLLIDEDGDWLAHFVELPNISAGGDTPEEALAELRLAWQLVKESYQKHGEPVPIAFKQAA